MNDIINYGGRAGRWTCLMSGLPRQVRQRRMRRRAPGRIVHPRSGNGVMSVSDQPIPGNQFAAIILDVVRLNTFYARRSNSSSSSTRRFATPSQ